MDTAEIWVRFAAAAMNDGNDGNLAAERADRMLDQFKRRYEWYSGGYGTFWRRKDKVKGDG